MRWQEKKDGWDVIDEDKMSNIGITEQGKKILII